MLPAGLPQAGIARPAVGPADFLRPLPPLSIPLSEPDPVVTLALQPLVDAVYARSHYYRDIDYIRPLRPPLSPVDAAWLEEWLGNNTGVRFYIGGSSSPCVHLRGTGTRIAGRSRLLKKT